MKINEIYIINIMYAIVGLMTFCTLLAVFYSALDYKYDIHNLKLLGSYECGFLPYGSSRIDIDINFSAIAVLFIVFDIETILVLPYMIEFSLMETKNLVSLIIFLMIFVIGLFHEVKSEIIII